MTCPHKTWVTFVHFLSGLGLINWYRTQVYLHVGGAGQGSRQNTTGHLWRHGRCSESAAHHKEATQGSHQQGQLSTLQWRQQASAHTCQKPYHYDGDHGPVWLHLCIHVCVCVTLSLLWPYRWVSILNTNQTIFLLQDYMPLEVTFINNNTVTVQTSEVHLTLVSFDVQSSKAKTDLTYITQK